MARGLTTATKNQFIAGSYQPAIFAEVQTTVGYVRAWTGLGDITWNAVVWTGVGKFGNVSPISESVDVRADGVKLALSGIPSALITAALSEIKPGKTAKVWFGALDANGAAVVDPFASFSGKVDSVALEESGATATIEISCENRLLSRLHRPHERRYTDQDQQIDFAGDLGFAYVDDLQEENISWGKKTLPIRRPPIGGGEGKYPDDLPNQGDYYP